MTADAPTPTTPAPMTAERLSIIRRASDANEFFPIADVTVRELLADRDALTARIAELEQTVAAHAGEPVTWERLRDAHSGMIGTEPWAGQGPNEGHRVYKQSPTEACYMCAALRRIKSLETELAAAQVALKEAERRQEAWRQAAFELQDQHANAEAKLETARRDKDTAYLERNKLVAFLARQFPSGIAKTAIEGWSDDWHGCVYIDTPTGQMSWHYHDSQAHLFADLPPYQGRWDGHTTEQKYERLRALQQKDTAP